MNRPALRREYKGKKSDIKKRLREFKKVGLRSDKRIFEELAFCILTPQSRAVMCDRAITALTRSGKLFNGSRCEVRKGLYGVRFPNNKAQFLIEARRLFRNGRTFCLKRRIDPSDVAASRDWLAKEVKGLGYKEASHFLRNIGLGKDLAILDVHILRNLKKLGVIRSVSNGLTRKRYISIEKKLRKFSDEIKIPMGELDLLFWSKETGYIFK